MSTRKSEERLEEERLEEKRLEKETLEEETSDRSDRSSTTTNLRPETLFLQPRLLGARHPPRRAGNHHRKARMIARPGSPCGGG